MGPPVPPAPSAPADHGLWRVGVVVCGCWAAKISQGSQLRVAELCEGSLPGLDLTGSFAGLCALDVDTRESYSLMVVACLFLADIISVELWRLPPKLATCGSAAYRCSRRRLRRFNKRRMKQAEKQRYEAEMQAQLHVQRAEKLRLDLLRKVKRDARRERERSLRKQRSPLSQRQQARAAVASDRTDSDSRLLESGVSGQSKAATGDRRGAVPPISPELPVDDDGMQNNEVNIDSDPENEITIDDIKHQAAREDADKAGSVKSDSAASESTNVSSSSTPSTSEYTKDAFLQVGHVVWTLAAVTLIIFTATAFECRQLYRENHEWSSTVARVLDTELVLHIGLVMHETQKERGLTTIMIASRGQTMGIELGRQQIASDAAMKGMFEALNRHQQLTVDSAQDAEPAQSSNVMTMQRADSLSRSSALKKRQHAVMQFVNVLVQRRAEFVDDARSPTDTFAQRPHPRRSKLETQEAFASAISFYSDMHQSLISLANEISIDVLSGSPREMQLAPTLFAFLNLMVLKEKAGIERALISGELTFQGRSTVAYNGSAISLSALVQLREVVAQQEGYLEAFLSFAPSWALQQYRSHQLDSCVAATSRMRYHLLTNIHELPSRAMNWQERGALATSGSMREQAFERDARSTDEAELSAIYWYKMQTCRIDGLNRLATNISTALRKEINRYQERSWYRLLRIAGPLVIALLLTAAIVIKAVVDFLEFQRASEDRFRALREDNAVYKSLAEQWAPLSMWAVAEQDADGDASS